MHCAQNAPPGMVVSSVSMVDWDMVPLVASSMLKGMEIAMSRRTILYEAMLVSVSMSGVATVMSPVVKAGPAQKKEGMSLVLTSMRQVNTLAVLINVYLAHGNLGLLQLWPRSYSCLMLVMALVNVQHSGWKMGQMGLSIVMTQNLQRGS